MKMPVTSKTVNKVLKSEKNILQTLLQKYD